LLPLDSERWNTLNHAFGMAWDIPDRLRQIAAGETDADPWGYLHAVLCHQLSVADAAYAAVPHLVALCEAAPVEDRWRHIKLISLIEGCRQVKESFVAEIPPDLAAAYFAALGRLPALIADCAALEWNQETAQLYAGALAIVKGHGELGLAIQNMSLEVICPECGREFHYVPW
jgi:hypothetical protein